MEKAIEQGNVLSQEVQLRVTKLHTVLRPYLLRRLKRDVEKELPSKYEHLVLCRLSKRQRFLYDEFMSRNQTREDLKSGVYQRIANILFFFSQRMTVGRKTRNDYTITWLTGPICRELDSVCLSLVSAPDAPSTTCHWTVYRSTKMTTGPGALRRKRPGSTLFPFFFVPLSSFVKRRIMQLRKVCNHPDLFEVRPIVTSFAMERSAIADFEIKELLICSWSLMIEHSNSTSTF